MFGRYHVTEPQPSTTGARRAGAPRSGSGRDRRSTSSLCPAAATRRRTRRTARSRRRRRASGSIRSDLNIKLPAQDGALHHLVAVRAGVVGQQPDAPRVVPHRELRSRASTGSSQAYIDADGSERRRPRAGEQRRSPAPPAVSPRSRSQRAGLEVIQGSMQLIPGWELDHLRAALLRGGPATRQRPAVPVRRGGPAGFRHAFCGQTVAGRPRPAARPDPGHGQLHSDAPSSTPAPIATTTTTTTPGTATTTPATTAPTTTTVPLAAGAPRNCSSRRPPRPCMLQERTKATGRSPAAGRSRRGRW